jgi:SAM-dependent methyltransferase
LSTAAWDRFWKYDRLASFGTGPALANYGPAIAAGWRTFFQSLPTGAKVLDIATGNGALAVIAVQANKSFSVTGVDLADVKPAAFVSQAKRELKRIRFLARTPAEELPLPDTGFDAVVSQYGIEYSNMSRSVPEAVRVLAPAGRLRFACHAAEGTVAADTQKSIVDAGFLLDEIDLTGRAVLCFEAILGVERGGNAGQLAQVAAQGAYANFRDALKAVAERIGTARDRAMLASVHQTLTSLFQDRQSHGLPALIAKVTDLRSEIAAHRERQQALLEAAQPADRMAELAEQLRGLGLNDVALGDQRDGADLIGHVIEARRPS